MSVDHPLVRRRTHHQRADAGEPSIPIAVVGVVGHLEEPVEAVVLVGDESVEGARREVLDLDHGSTVGASTDRSA
jgi:hypothetical protein